MFALMFAVLRLLRTTSAKAANGGVFTGIPFGAQKVCFNFTARKLQVTEGEGRYRGCITHGTWPSLVNGEAVTSSIVTLAP